MTLRIGVIGLGNMGADHAQTLHRFVSGAQVTALADVNRARADAVAAAIPGARSTDDALAVIEDSDVDAVLIASHDTTHAEYSLACLQAAKPVMCEKPLALTVAESARVVETERAALGSRAVPLISVGFMRRFDPGYAQLRQLLANGQLGAPLLVHCRAHTVASYPGTRTEDVVIASAVHDFEIVPWLVDSPVVQVSWHAGRATSRVQGMQDPQLILLRTANGVLATVESFVNAGYGYDIRCEVVGETGVASIWEPARIVIDKSRQRATPYAEDWRLRFADAYRLELQAWVDAVAGGHRPPLATAGDALIANAVANAVVISMNSGGQAVAVQVPDLAEAGR
jgi:myo-inositol 2-dehydrogenase / D-chiro-inositol 1-dehydrogenase